STPSPTATATPIPPPVAVNDSYSALGNVAISIPTPGVLGNDTLNGGAMTGYAATTALLNSSPTTPGSPTTTAQGGNVTLNADGSFTYNPPAGFEGNDSFVYRLTNGGGSADGTVTITVGGMLWFIDNNQGTAGDGRLSSPFNTLAAFQAVNNGTGNHPAANDNIFLYSSATNYVGPVTLLNGQKLIGQGATSSLSTITGLTPPTGSAALPATGGTSPVLVT